jgi:HK97 family phage prohead protease
MNIENKMIGGNITETKQEDRSGVPIGFISGYIATWDIDRGDDKFTKGAFLDSIKEHATKKRQIRFKDHHGRTIGGFPFEGVKEDDRGLFGTAEVNLDVQQGREAFSLAKQGVLTDFSIGFSAVDWEIKDDLRIINKAIVWEGSIVDEPMNVAANITEVKSVVPYQDLPLADRDRRWDASAAKKRVRAWAGADDGLDTAAIQRKYRRAFLWYDQEEPENFGSYKMPIADVIDGTLTAVPRGIFAAAVVLRGGRGGVDIPSTDKTKVINHLNRYYAKMDLPSPFKDESSFRIDDFKSLSDRELEEILNTGVYFSGKNAKVIISALKAAGLRDGDSDGHRDGDNWDCVITGLNELKKLMEDK